MTGKRPVLASRGAGEEELSTRSDYLRMMAALAALAICLLRLVRPA